MSELKGPMHRQTWGLAGAVTLGIGLLLALGTFEPIERALFEARLRLRGPVAPPPDVRVIAIDERSLQQLGPAPWDRRRYAELVDRLADDGARAIALDIAFQEPSADPEADRSLARALAHSGRVVLPAYRTFSLSGSMGLHRPLPVLARAAAAIGFAQFSTAPETQVSRLEPQQEEGTRLMPVLGLALARVAGLDVPSTQPGDLNPLGPAGHFPTRSFVEALHAPAGTYRGAVVLVGSTARGMPDTNFAATFPDRGPLSGVELHATALANLVGGSVVHRPGVPLRILWLLFAGLVPGAWLASTASRRPGVREGALAAMLIALMGLGVGAIAHAVWIDLAAPALILVGSYVAGLAAREWELLKERARWLERYARDLQREARRERARLDGELHDEAQQLVVAMQRDLRRALKRLPGEPERAATLVQQVEGLAQQTFDEIMRLRKALVPHVLATGGLRAALEAIAEEAGSRAEELEVRVEVGSWPEGLDAELAEELYWLVKEALNNVVKHAGARHVTIGLESRGDRVHVSVRDDGGGFVVPDYRADAVGPEHSGMRRMWARAAARGGDLAVESAPGKGATLTWVMPWKEARA